MKPIITFLLVLTVSLILTSCSRDNVDSLDLGIENMDTTQDTNPQNPDIPKDKIPDDQDIPMVPLAEIGAVAIDGYPKTIKKFENGILNYWAQYYFRADGNIIKVNYGYPSSTSEIFSNNYLYDTEGKMVKLVGWDVFDFYWDNGRIVKVEAYNGAWYGRYDIFYNYNDQGQVIQKLEVYYGTTPISSQKFTYSYLTDGNLKSIEQYGDYNESGTFKLYTETNFSDYIEPRNIFLELEIIPGQRELLQFPGSKDFKHYTSTGYDVHETYSYEYDTLGRVIEKSYGDNKIVYDYY